MNDDELARAIEELTRTLEALQGELASERGRPPLRPPTPEEFLRATDEIAIPAVIALLEANVRALKATQRGVQLLRRERQLRDSVETRTDKSRGAANELGRTTLEQLDVALTALQRGVARDDPRTRELLEDARTLRAELASRLDEVAGIDERASEPYREPDTASEAFSIEIDEVDDPESTTSSEPEVDVDAELETLRERYGSPDDTDDESSNDESDNDAIDGGDESGTEADTANREDDTPMDSSGSDPTDEETETGEERGRNEADDSE